MSNYLSAVALTTVATGSIWLGSVLGASRPDPKLDSAENEVVELSWTQVMLLPVTSSLFLLLMFFYFKYFQIILVFVLVIGCTATVFDVCQSITRTFYHRYYGNVSAFVSAAFAFLSVIEWARTGSFIANDILGCSLCIACISVIRFPSLKLATLCLGLLVLYDIYWVFFSEYFFHKNVMVTVATKVASNPIQSLGERFSIPLLRHFKRHLELPVKLIIPAVPHGRYMMLGLGDIALPGFLVALALRCDTQLPIVRVTSKDSADNLESGEPLLSAAAANSSKNFVGLNLFSFALGGYIVGLFTAFFVSSYFNHAQPALIYLVPGVFLPIFFRAWQKGCLMEVWNGPKKIKIEDGI
jgi:signal peptide peptidase-like protein 3